MIPKIIHFIWVGSNPLPEVCARYISEWTQAYSDYTIKLWTDSDIADAGLITSELKSLYDDPTMPCAFKADVARYAIVNKFGGIYLDTDFQFLKRIPSELFEHDFLGGIQNNGQIAIGFFAAIPNTDLLNEVIEQLPYSFNRAKDLGWYQAKYLEKISGPEFFDSIARKYSTNDKYLFFDSKYLYPYSWLEPHRSSEDFCLTQPQAYAVHHWHKTWK